MKARVLLLMLAGATCSFGQNYTYDFSGLIDTDNVNSSVWVGAGSWSESSSPWEISPTPNYFPAQK